MLSYLVCFSSINRPQSIFWRLVVASSWPIGQSADIAHLLTWLRFCNRNSYMICCCLMTKEEKAIVENKLRELASMVERQENGRQKLLAEVQSENFMPYFLWKTSLDDYILEMSFLGEFLGKVVYTWALKALWRRFWISREHVETSSVTCQIITMWEDGSCR